MHSLTTPPTDPCPRCSATSRRDTDSGVECAHCGFPLAYPPEGVSVAEILEGLRKLPAALVTDQPSPSQALLFA